MTKPRLVWIHTPTRNAMAHQAHRDSIDALMRMAREGTSRGFSFGFRYDQGGSNIGLQRSIGAARALANGAETMLCVDSDIAFDPEEALDVLERDEPIIGVSHQVRPQRWSDPPIMSGRFIDPLDAKHPMFDHSKDLLEAALVTTGFLAIKTSVFMTLREREVVRRFYVSGCDAATLPHLYDYFIPSLNETHPSPGVAADLKAAGLPSDTALAYDGEDWDFCRKCCRLGIPIALEPLNTVYHHDGAGVLDLGLHDYWVQHETTHRAEYLRWLHTRGFARGDKKALRLLEAAWGVLALRWGADFAEEMCGIRLEVAADAPAA